MINGENWNFNMGIWISVTNAPLMIAVFEFFDLVQFEPYEAQKTIFIEFEQWGLYHQNMAKPIPQCSNSIKSLVVKSLSRLETIFFIAFYRFLVI